MSLQRLMELVPAPRRPIETGTSDDWRLVEQRLGTELPSDYKAFIRHYGSGHFNDFIVPFNPFAARRHINLNGSAG